MYTSQPINQLVSQEKKKKKRAGQRQKNVQGRRKKLLTTDQSLIYENGNLIFTPLLDSVLCACIVTL